MATQIRCPFEKGLKASPKYGWNVFYLAHIGVFANILNVLYVNV